MIQSLGMLVLASAESYEAGRSAGRVFAYIVIGLVVLLVLWVIKRALG